MLPRPRSLHASSVCLSRALLWGLCHYLLQRVLHQGPSVGGGGGVPVGVGMGVGVGVCVWGCAMQWGDQHIQ